MELLGRGCRGGSGKQGKGQGCGRRWESVDNYSVKRNSVPVASHSLLIHLLSPISLQVFESVVVGTNPDKKRKDLQDQCKSVGEGNCSRTPGSRSDLSLSRGWEGHYLPTLLQATLLQSQNTWPLSES